MVCFIKQNKMTQFLQDNQIGQLVGMLKLFIEVNDIMYVRSESNYHELYSILRDKLETTDENVINDVIYQLLTA